MQQKHAEEFEELMLLVLLYSKSPGGEIARLEMIKF